MKVLQLFSDWKWTGPAEPVLSLCETLPKEGVDVTIAYRKTPIDFPERTVEKEVKARRLKLFDGFRLNRYFSPRDWLFDMGAVKEYAIKENIDIIHTNLAHDHFTALLSIALSRKKPLIVRTDHKRDGTPYSYFMGWAFAKTDGLVSYGKRIMNHDMKAFQFPEVRTCVIPPAITAHKGPVKNLRGEFGIKEKEKIIGVIGRLKPDRGYDIILKGFKELRDRMNGVKLIVVGRSSQIEKSIVGPISELGIQDDVILAGYRIDDYFSMISTFDLFIMMRAGSDGSARALREVMAMGKAAIVADSGMLPELVRDGVSGYVVKADPHELADRMERVLKDEGQRNTFEKNAQKIAAEEWNYSAQARRLKEFYERLLALGKRPPPERSLRG